MSLKDLILSADDRPTATVKVPEWKCSVTIRAFSAGDRDAIEMQIASARLENKPVENIRAKIAALIIIDENGNRVFTDAEIPVLAAKSAKALDRIFDAHLKLNKLTEDEADEYEKNS